MFKNILVPIDGSEQSNLALNFAMDLAKKYSAKVTLLHVAQQYFQEPIFPKLSTRNTADIEDAHRQLLSKMFDEAKKMDSEVKVSKKLLFGRPADKIIETSKKEGIDLIVIGSRGLGGIKEFLLGSVSDRVADRANCQVLIVKKNRKAA